MPGYNMLYEDNTKRRMRAGDKYTNTRLRVVAERVDYDTPYIHLTLLDGDGNDMATAALEDCVVIDLIKMLQRAIDILPSSK